MEDEVQEIIAEPSMWSSPYLYAAIGAILLVLLIVIRDEPHVRRFLRNQWYKVYNWFVVKITKPLPLRVVKGDYPANTRYVSEDKKPFMRRDEDLGRIRGHAFCFVVEVKPGIRMVNIGRAPVALYFPWTYFIIRYIPSHSEFGAESLYAFCSLAVCFSDEQIRDTSGMIGMLPLSNYMDNCQVCLGSSSPKGIFSNLRDLGEAAITVFWRTSFQMGLPQDWAYHTKHKTGEYWAKDHLLRTTTIGKLLGVTQREPFYDYQFEPKPVLAEPDPASTGGDEPPRRKKRKSPSRKKKG